MKQLIFTLLFMLLYCDKLDAQLSTLDFVKKHRLIPDNIYKMISSSFLGMTNKERLQILNKLFCTSNKKSNR